MLKRDKKAKKEKSKALNEMVLRDNDRSKGREINVLRKQINDLLDSEETIGNKGLRFSG